MNIGLIVPPARPEAMALAAEAAAYLRGQGASVLCQPETAASLAGCAVMCEDSPVDALVCVGGDGTILYAAQLAAGRDIPLLGISMGTLGFLADNEPANATAALDALLRGECWEDRRPLLELTSGEDSWLAVNDCWLTRDSNPRLLSVQVLVDGREADSFRSDGVLVASPTGATGYALSAGGPLVSPQVDCLLVVPLYPHGLPHRPLVVRGDAVVTLRLQGDSLTQASLLADNRQCARLDASGLVTVRRSAKCMRLLHAAPFDFFGTVRTKLARR